MFSASLSSSRSSTAILGAACGAGCALAALVVLADGLPVSWVCLEAARDFPRPACNVRTSINIASNVCSRENERGDHMRWFPKSMEHNAEQRAGAKRATKIVRKIASKSCDHEVAHGGGGRARKRTIEESLEKI